MATPGSAGALTGESRWEWGLPSPHFAAAVVAAGSLVQVSALLPGQQRSAWRSARCGCRAPGVTERLLGNGVRVLAPNGEQVPSRRSVIPGPRQSQRPEPAPRLYLSDRGGETCAKLQRPEMKGQWKVWSRCVSRTTIHCPCGALEFGRSREQQDFKKTGRAFWSTPAPKARAAASAAAKRQLLGVLTGASKGTNDNHNGQGSEKETSDAVVRNPQGLDGLGSIVRTPQKTSSN